MSQAIFDVDPDFCGICGTFLTVYKKKAYLFCENCGFQLSENESKELKTHYSLQFCAEKDEELESTTQQQKSIGALVDRTCSKCGSLQMAYKTLQTKSADEGQTVFYACPSCDYAEMEHS